MARSIKTVFLILQITFIPGLLLPFSVNAQEEKPLKVGLVLSGGGARGFAHIGVIKVLEEAGIQPDIITGTSMGSIIGGLYALGYPIETIDSLVRAQNWEDLFKDQVNRRYSPAYEREEEDQYFLQLPIENKRIQLPSGLITGYKIHNLFSRLSFPYHHITDFKKLPIPFACVAVDIETGESVTLDQGYLPNAIRASMSIPTAFTPVELDGRLLVDGGVINNFPVTEALEMGADIIIGISVEPSDLSKEELRSPLNMLKQMGKFLRQPLDQKHMKMCDFLIHPQLDNFHLSSFHLADSIIKAGEEATRKLLPQLKEFEQKINHNKKPRKRNLALQTAPIPIKSIIVNGIPEDHLQQFFEKLHMTIPAQYTLDEIEEALDRIYAMKKYEHLSYKLLPEDNQYILHINSKEKYNNKLLIGINYDNEFGANVKVGVTYRQLNGRDDRLAVNLKLGENYSLLANYMRDRGNRLGVDITVGFDRKEVYLYEDYIQKERYELYNPYGQFGFKASPSGPTQWGLGLKTNHLFFQPITTPEPQNYHLSTFNYYFFWNTHTFDRAYFPRRGVDIKLRGELITDNLYQYDGQKPVLKSWIKTQWAVPLSQKVTWHALANGGVVFQKEQEAPYFDFFLGGELENFDPSVVPFPGLKLMQEHGEALWTLGSNLQISLGHSHYLTLKTSIGEIAPELDNLVTLRGTIIGGGISYGYNSLFGPLELSLSDCSVTGEPQLFFRLGFRF